MACISLGRIDKTLIVIFIGCIVCFANRLLNSVDSALYKNSILLNIFISLSRFLAVIPFIILKRKTKKTNSSISDKDSDVTSKKVTKLIYNSGKSVIRNKWSFILLSSVICTIQIFVMSFSIKIKTNSWILDILFASIFYYLIYRINLYRHHYLSVILIISIGLSVDLVTGNLQDDIINRPLHLTMRCLKEIFSSLLNVVAKYTIEKKFVSVYEFSTYIGLFGIILLIIFTLFDYYIFNLLDYDAYFSSFDFIELLILFGVILTQFGINLTVLFTVKNNSPCHAFIIFAFGQFAVYQNLEGLNILILIPLIVILFLALIFNEIIEINILGLSYNTKRNIINRADNDFLTKVGTSDSENDSERISIEMKHEELNEYKTFN